MCYDGYPATTAFPSLKPGIGGIGLLGNDLKGLGLELPKSSAGDEAVKRLCAEVNLDPRLVELGHLILFNLECLTK